MSTKSQELKNKINDLKKDYLKSAKEEFKQQSNGLFDEYPRLKSFGWTQFTPHFCDGDPCYFGVRNDEPEINGYNAYGEGNDGDGENLNLLSNKQIYKDGKYVDNQNYDREADKIVKEVVKFLKSFDDDVYEDLFGDHMKVTIYKNKIDTDEYQHD
jgi:hypothetical protein